MRAKNVSVAEMEKALLLTTEKFDFNVAWNRFEVKGNSIHFTLKVLDSSGLGHRLGQSLTSKGNRRKMTSACWHVHGIFFEKLILEVNKKAVVKSLGKTLCFLNANEVENNWIDWNIGSMASPFYHSEACDCNS